MPKMAVVSLAQLGDRWDADFHIALDQLRARVEQLRDQLPESEARRRLAGVALPDKAPLLVLARGSMAGLSQASVERIERSYPHFAIALLERDMARAVARIQEQIQRDQSYLNALMQLALPPTAVAETETTALPGMRR